MIMSAFIFMRTGNNLLCLLFLLVLNQTEHKQSDSMDRKKNILMATAETDIKNVSEPTFIVLALWTTVWSEVRGFQDMFVLCTALKSH